MKFVLYSKTNKDKSTEIFPPLLLKPPYTCACPLCRAESLKKVSKRFKFKRSRQYFGL